MTLLLFTFLSLASSFETGSINLEHGSLGKQKTSYKLLRGGNPGDPFVVFVHGGTLDCSGGTWDFYMQQMASKKRNVVCFDNYGAGNSSLLKKKPKHTKMDFGLQLEEFLKTHPDLKGKQNDVVAVSQGACSLARVVGKSVVKEEMGYNPSGHGVRTMTFLSPAIDVAGDKKERTRKNVRGEGFVDRNVRAWKLWASFDASQNYSAESRFGKTIIGRLPLILKERVADVVKRCPEAIRNDILARVDRFGENRDKVSAFYSKLRGNAFGGCSKAFEKALQSGIPFLTITGDQDDEVAPNTVEKTFRRHVSSQSRLIRVPDATHGMLCENPELIASALDEFLSSGGGQPGSPTGQHIK